MAVFPTLLFPLARGNHLVLQPKVWTICWWGIPQYSGHYQSSYTHILSCHSIVTIIQRDKENQRKHHRNQGYSHDDGFFISLSHRSFSLQWYVCHINPDPTARTSPTAISLAADTWLALPPSLLNIWTARITCLLAWEPVLIVYLFRLHWYVVMYFLCSLVAKNSRWWQMM